MLNSRSVSKKSWVDAHKCLLYYFTRRRCSNPEDLAQETLLAVWEREDFQFEKEEDFLKVCYGFARRILQEGYRDDRKHAADELTPDIEYSPSEGQALHDQEFQVFSNQIRDRAEAALQEEELALIVEAMQRDGHEPPFPTKLRVKLHRARKKLKKIIGLDK